MPKATSLVTSCALFFLLLGYSNPIKAQTYCTPTYTTGCSSGDAINNVTLSGENASLNNSTGCSSSSYGDYTDELAADLLPNNTYQISVTTNYSVPTSEQLKAWIDYNNDGNFTENEVIAATTNGMSGATQSFNFTVPSTASLGYTRMRVRMVYGASATVDPCNSASWGETEDYLVYIGTIPNCSSANAGTISSNKSAVCADENYSLTVSGATMPGNGMTYQWQESPAGQNTWTDITGATNMSYTTNGLTDATDYRLIVSCSFGNLSDTSNVTTVNPSPAMDCLCTPIYTSGCNIGARVDGVTTTMGITNISNTGTGCNEMDATGYTDYSSTHSASALQAAMMGIEVDVSNYSGGVKVWIDWNQNGVFEANELVTESSSTISAGSSHSDNFTVPTNAVPGNTRMRVRVVEGSTSFDPCGSASYGETEDYTFEVIQGTPCSGQPDLAAISGPTDVCPDVSFMLHGTGISQADITYQWQESPHNLNNWTDIAGAVNSSHNVANGINAPTDFRLIATCTNSNLSDTSNVVEVDISDFIDCYCTPIYSYGCNIGARVDGVTTTMGITNISNTGTGCNEMDGIGYTNYSSTHSASALQAAMMGIEVDVSNYSGGVKVWIDWNQNGVFESNELVTESSSTITAGNSHSDNFIVPATAVPGITRMRVRVVEGSTSFDPCGTAYYGETEDYTFEVIQGTPCSGTPTAALSSSDTSVCPDVAFTLIGEGVAFADIEYQWQESPSNQNTWTNITGATSTTLHIANGINADMDYRMIVTCTNSNLSDTTDALEVAISPVTDCYCDPIYTGGDYTSNFSTSNAIQNVSFSTSSTYNYNNFSATDTIIADAGTTIDFSHTYVGGSNTVVIWVDWNQNGIFDAAEIVSNTYSASATQTGTIDIPANTPSGTYRLRLRSRYSTTVPGPCSSETFGSALDYTLQVGSCEDPIVDLGSDVTICEGESITLDAGNPGLDYEWSTNETTQTITVNSAGTYTVTVTDGDCSTTESITVTVQALPVVDLGADTHICDGETLTLDAGNPGANYEWNDNSTGQTLDVTSGGTYSVTVTEGNCSASDEIVITELPAPSASGMNANNAFDCLFGFTVTNPQNVDEYIWDFGDGSPTETTTNANNSHNYASSGTYTVSVTLVNDCAEDVVITKEVNCDNGVSIDELDNAKQITIYPNPAKDKVTIEGEEGVVMEHITIYNVVGQKVYDGKANSAEMHSMEVSQFASGMYTVRIETQNGVMIKKFEIIK